MSWVSQPVLRWSVVVMLAGGLICAVAALRIRRDPGEAGGLYVADRDAEVGHLVMVAAMLAMVAAPTWDLHRWWRALFALLAAFFAVRLLWHFRDAVGGEAGSGARSRVGGAGYHLVGSLAMFAAATPGGGEARGGHHHGMEVQPTGWTSTWSWLRWLVALLFVADAVFTAIILVTGRVPGSDEPSVPPRGRVAFVPHLVMDVGMVLML